MTNNVHKLYKYKLVLCNSLISFISTKPYHWDTSWRWKKLYFNNSTNLGKNGWQQILVWFMVERCNMYHTSQPLAKYKEENVLYFLMFISISLYFVCNKLSQLLYCKDLMIPRWNENNN